jgi:hypothetical protein
MAEVKTVGVRELKNKLSAYLREVRAGVRMLVSGRDTVVAELHEPWPDQSSAAPPIRNSPNGSDPEQQSGLLHVTHAQGEPLQRLVILIEEPRTKVGGSAAVDDGTAHDVWPLLES